MASLAINIYKNAVEAKIFHNMGDSAEVVYIPWRKRKKAIKLINEWISNHSIKLNSQFYSVNVNEYAYLEWDFIKNRYK